MHGTIWNSADIWGVSADLFSLGCKVGCDLYTLHTHNSHLPDRVELSPAGDGPKTLLLGKDITGPIPSRKGGCFPVHTKGPFFFSSCIKCVPDWEFFRVMRFNSTGKDHLRFPKKANI